MDLLPKKLEQRFAEVGHQGNVYNPLVIAKYFDLKNVFHWYAMEYYPQDKCFWGYVKNLPHDYYSETAYFNLEELHALKWGNTGVPLVERDLNFKEKYFSEIQAEWQRQEMEQEVTRTIKQIQDKIRNQPDR